MPPVNARASWRDAPRPSSARSSRRWCARYPAPEPAEDLSRWTLAYAEAMGDVYAAHPDDLDVAALYADALLNLTAWAAMGPAHRAAGATGARTLQGQAGARGRAGRARGHADTPGSCTSTST